MPVQGSIRQVHGRMERYVNGQWVLKDSIHDTWEDDLQEAEASAKIEAMTPSPGKKREASLIPNAETYINAGLNILLYGPHGTGKTATIQQLAKDLNLRMKYFSCSTLDPYTDLIGIPTPRILCPDCGEFETRAEHRELNPQCKAQVTEILKNVRPHELDQAEFLFFDEFNRADPKTTNALFEIIQFRTLNGEPLPNLKVCWAAMNPPDEDYEVERLDPALLDRFDLYVPIQAKPSVSYMESRGIPKLIAAALQAWWSDHEREMQNGTKDNRADYVSPRRLEKIGHIWVATGGDVRAVKMALPTDATLDVQKLMQMLRMAQDKINKIEGGEVVDAPDELTYDSAGLGDAPNPQFTYTSANIALEKVELTEWLTNNPGHLPTHQKVSEVLRTGIGGEEMVKRLGMVLNALNPSVLEGLFSSFPVSKQRAMRTGFVTAYEADKAKASLWKNLHGVLSNGAGIDFPKL